MTVAKRVWLLLAAAVSVAACADEMQSLGSSPYQLANRWTAVVPLMRDGVEPTAWQDATAAIVETLRDRGVDARIVPSLQQIGAVQPPYLQISAAAARDALDTQDCRVRAQVTPVGANLPPLTAEAARDDVEQRDCIEAAVHALVKAMAEAGY